MSEKFGVRVKIFMILRSLLVNKGRKGREIWAEVPIFAAVRGKSDRLLVSALIGCGFLSIPGIPQPKIRFQ